MFDALEYYRRLNDEAIMSYKSSVVSIESIFNESKSWKSYGDKSEFYKFINHTSALILKLCKLESVLDDSYFNNKSLEVLKKENNELYAELLPENYETSYANPFFSVKVFGEKLGQLFSYFYIRYRNYINYTFKHQIYKMEKYNSLFIDVFRAVKDSGLEYEALSKLIARSESDQLLRDQEMAFHENYSGDYGFYSDVSKYMDLTDLRYLFRFGEYISDNEIQTAEFLLTYPEDELKILTAAIAEAYVNGFVRENKDITKRSTVRIIYNIGQERILNQLIKDFKKHNLDGFVNMAVTTDVNKQFGYDHRFDSALYLEEKYLGAKAESFEKAAENCSDMLAKYSGIMYFDKFGEAPFAPVNKTECLKLSDEQSKLFQKHKNKINMIRERYVPQTETSFCIVAFPTPEIGDNFREIFSETVRVNMLDSSKYEAIQQSIIDLLDKGEYVHVKGKGANLTDIKVKLHELSEPGKETNFLNCVADVNIPVGEVFTSPVLNGTNGILHLEEIFLEGLKYEGLKLNFKDGFISDYSCTNFQSEEENRKYIEENLLFPHKTLPIGEFAIGTNTTAYVMAQKYRIINILPVLIIEKMGPHFAIGDTCFSWSEDTPVYNMLDKKEIVARDNEKSILRKTNIDEAYTNCHTDITLPYDALEFISVITKNGEAFDIIRDGRFVIKGTEELNKPFDQE